MKPEFSSAEKTFQGAWKIWVWEGNYLVPKYFFGYTKKQAIKMATRTTK